MRTQTGVLFVAAFCLGVAGIVATTVIAANAVSAPAPPPDSSPIRIDPVSNSIAVTSQSEVLWNGRIVTLPELEETLQKSRAFPVEPELRFVPEPQASYQLSAEVLNIIKQSKVTKFGFVGNEKYRTDGKD